jgi:hypothetical protein
MSQLGKIATTAVDGGSYTITLTADEEITGQSLSFAGKTVAVVLKGSGGERKLTAKYQYPIFTIGSGVTLVLDSNITISAAWDTGDYYHP